MLFGQRCRRGDGRGLHGFDVLKATRRSQTGPGHISAAVQDPKCSGCGGAASPTCKAEEPIRNLTSASIACGPSVSHPARSALPRTSLNSRISRIAARTDEATASAPRRIRLAPTPPRSRLPAHSTSSRSLESGLDQDCQALGQCPMVMKELAMLQCRRSWLEGIRATSRDGPQFIGGRDHATRPSWYRHPGQRTI